MPNCDILNQHYHLGDIGETVSKTCTHFRGSFWDKGAINFVSLVHFCSIYQTTYNAFSVFLLIVLNMTCRLCCK